MDFFNRNFAKIGLPEKRVLDFFRFSGPLCILRIHFALFLMLKIETNLKKPKGICKMTDQSLLTQIHPPRVSCCDRFMAKTRKRTTSKYDFGWPLLLLLRSISCTTAEQKRLWVEGRINIWISDHPIRPPATPFFMTPCNPRLKRTVRLSLKVSRAKKGKNYWLDLIGAPSSPVPAWLVCLGSFLLATNCSFLLTMLHSQLLLYSCHSGPIWTFKNVLIHMI